MQKAMSKLKKPLKVILVLLICYLLLFLFCKPIFYRLYLGHRIKGDISVTVNNGNYTLKETQFSGTDKIKIKDHEAKVSVKAGKYGEYNIYLDLSDIYAEAKPINISCFQSNWWNKLDFELDIEVDTKNKTMKFNGECISVDNTGTQQIQPVENPDEIFIRVGGP